MRIGICGSHSTGKTTLVEALRTEPYFKDYYFDINVTRWVKEAGFPINEETNDFSQEINLVKRIAHLNSFDNIICDRTIVDVFAYSSFGKNISVRSVAYQSDLVYANLHKYDYIFYLPTSIKAVDDGVRAIDPEYREKIAQFILDSLDMFNVKYMVINGSIRERVSIILDEISRKNDLSGLQKHESI